SQGDDLELFEPREKRPVIVSEWRPGERPLNRSVLRALEELPDWELVFVRTKPLTGRPTIPRELRGRVTVRTARDGKARSELFAHAAIFVPALAGLARASLEA